MLLHSLLRVVVHVLLVLHPRRDGEVLVERVVQLGARDLNGRATPIEEEDLVLLLAVVSRQVVRPLAQRGRREQVDAARRGAWKTRRDLGSNCFLRDEAKMRHRLDRTSKNGVWLPKRGL